MTSVYLQDGSIIIVYTGRRHSRRWCVLPRSVFDIQVRPFNLEFNGMAKSLFTFFLLHGRCDMHAVAAIKELISWFLGWVTRVVQGAACVEGMAMQEGLQQEKLPGSRSATTRLQGTFIYLS